MRARHAETFIGDVHVEHGLMTLRFFIQMQFERLLGRQKYTAKCDLIVFVSDLDCSLLFGDKLKKNKEIINDIVSTYVFL